MQNSAMIFDWNYFTLAKLSKNKQYYVENWSHIALLNLYKIIIKCVIICRKIVDQLFVWYRLSELY